jgi:hypothetical protein
MVNKGYDGCIGNLMNRKSFRRFMALGLMLLGLTFVAGGVTSTLVNQRIANPTAAPLPIQVAHLQLTSHMFGRTAKAEVSRLHNQEFVITSASVGRYGYDQAITIWVTGAPLNILASRMVVAMRDKIAEVDTPFDPIGEQKIGNRIIYELVGLGQNHYYFQSANLVVWIAADEDLAEQVLFDLLDFYP